MIRSCVETGRWHRAKEQVSQAQGRALLSPIRQLSAQRAGTPFSKSNVGNGNLPGGYSYQRVSCAKH